jgi:hypothetical protein
VILTGDTSTLHYGNDFNVKMTGVIPAGITKILYFLHILFISRALEKRIREWFPIVASGVPNAPFLPYRHDIVMDLTAKGTWLTMAS